MVRARPLWIYIIAPALGMLAGAEIFLRVRCGAAPYCAQLHHANNTRCIFHLAQQEVLFPEKNHSSSEGGKGESACKARVIVHPLRYLRRPSRKSLIL